MTPNTAEEPKDRWIRLLDRACGELTKVYRFRIVYTDVGKIIEENGTLPDSEIFALIQDGYAYMQALAVRRQVDWKDTCVESLGRVLHEMIKHPDEATAAGFDVADIEADAQRLRVDTATVRAYVDQTCPLRPAPPRRVADPQAPARCDRPDPRHVPAHLREADRPVLGHRSDGDRLRLAGGAHRPVARAPERPVEAVGARRLTTSLARERDLHDEAHHQHHRQKDERPSQPHQRRVLPSRFLRECLERRVHRTGRATARPRAERDATTPNDRLLFGCVGHAHSLDIGLPRAAWPNRLHILIRNGRTGAEGALHTHCRSRRPAACTAG